MSFKLNATKDDNVTVTVSDGLDIVTKDEPISAGDNTLIIDVSTLDAGNVNGKFIVTVSDKTLDIII